MGDKIKNKFQLICPYCDAELRISISVDGLMDDMDCPHCNKNFKYSYGKVESAVGLTGNVAKQCFLRMDIINPEKEISWYATRGIHLKKGDLILVVWGKRFFNKDAPKYISNFTTGIRNLL